MLHSDRDQGRQAAGQGLGMPAGLSLAGQQAYEDERRRRADRELPAFRMPGPPIDPEGLAWVLALPFLALWFVFADLRHGWRWWRWTGLLLGVLVSVAAFGLAVQAGVRGDLAQEAGQAVGRFAGERWADLFLNAATAGGVAIVMFLFPRTCVALVALVGLIQAWTTWVSPLLAG